LADSWFFLSFFPAKLILWNCGSGRDEEPSGEKVLRPIQIRLATLSLEKWRLLVKTILCHANGRLQFHKRRQLFIRPSNETLSVAAMKPAT
jgi:hypothetical protein